MKNKKAYRKKIPSRRKKSSKLWYIPGLIYVFIFGFLIWIFKNENEVEFFNKIKIRSFKVLNAKVEEKLDTTKEGKGEKMTSDLAQGLSNKKTVNRAQSNQKIMDNHDYLSTLNERKKELDRRDQELSELELELHKQKKEVELRIKDLKKIRHEISKLFEQKITADEKKVKKLVDIYSNMKPQQAADALKIVDEDLAIAIMGKMKKKNTADILNLLPPDKAKRLSEMFAGYEERKGASTNNRNESRD